MSLSKFVITLGLIAFAAVGLAQAQSTWSPEQRKGSRPLLEQIRSRYQRR